MSDDRTSAGHQSTTTVSSVAIQAGDSRIVIAILKCGELVQLQLAESIPNLIEVPSCQDEAKKLVQDHDALLYKLKSLEDHVWDLLCQADETAEQNKDQSQLYDAMALSLKEAWSALIIVLERRRDLLHMAAAFFDNAIQFADAIDNAESFLQNTPDTAESITECLQQLQEHTKALLERSLSLLYKSQELTEFIQQFKSLQPVASSEMMRGAHSSCSQIEDLLELLQDKRRQLDKQMRQHRQRLEQVLQVSQWLQQEDKVTCWLREHIDLYLTDVQLGASLTENEELLHKHKQLILNAKDWNLAIAKLKTEAQQLAAVRDCAHREELNHSNQTLNSLHAEFWQLMDRRQVILQEANDFFKCVNKAFDKLGGIETYLRHLKMHNLSLPELSAKQKEVEAEIGKCTSDAFHKGQTLVKKSPFSPGMTGIQEMIGYLQKRVDQLTCHSPASTENSLKQQEIVASLEDRLKEVSAWINNINSGLNWCSDPGLSIGECEDVLNKLGELAKQTKEASKCMESAAQLLREVTQTAPLGDEVFTSNSRLLDDKLRVLDQRIDEKLEVINVYIAFLKSSKELDSHIQNLKAVYAPNPEEVSVSQLESVESRIQSVLDELFSVQDMGQNCLNIIKMMKKNTILKDKHMQKVEDTMANLNKEKAEITKLWAAWRQHVNQVHSSTQQWRTIRDQLRLAASRFQELEKDLQPLSAMSLGNDDAQNISIAQENLHNIKAKFQKLNDEMEHAVKISELIAREGTQANEKTVKMNYDLAENRQRLKDSITEYEEVLCKLVEFYKMKTELNILKTELDPPTPAPAMSEVHSVRSLEQQAHIQSLYKIILNLGAQIISTAQHSKHITVPLNDLQLQLQDLEHERVVWNSNVEKRQENVSSNVNSTSIEEVSELKESFKDLKKKFNNLKFNYTKKADKGRNLKVIKNQIQQVEMYLEKIQSQFWCEEACATVVRVGRYSADCKTREAVEVLVKQFNKFVQPALPQQEERIQQMINIAKHIYGTEDGIKYVEKTLIKHKEALNSVNELCIYLKELEEKLEEPQKAPEISLSDERELPLSAKDGNILADADLQPELLAEEAASGDEYECISPDDISLPPLAETPESNHPQSETEQDEPNCYSSHSMHVSSYSLQMHINASGKRVMDGSDFLTPVSAYTDTSSHKRENTSSYIDRFCSPPVGYKTESPFSHQSTVVNETRYALSTSPAKAKPNYRMVNEVHESRLQSSSVYESTEKTEQLHASDNTARTKDRLHAVSDEFSGLVFQSDPAKSCQRHMVTQEAIRSVSEKHNSVSLAGQSPAFSKLPPNVTVKEGSPVTLEVEVTGYPEPTLTWYRKDTKHSTDDHLLSRERDTSHTLIIREVCKKDLGQYIGHTSIYKATITKDGDGKLARSRPPISEVDWITLLAIYVCVSVIYWLLS
ncbi:coiled-coil domain-containing protein 141 isoform X2 [Pseudophryne corroboree]|uniref:coiled-coil domain-containing protein 141 isoform X2 n=1 Tax=Pseudophryne corroboree TaxID=495146 RepID=UPI003081CCA4